VRPSLYRHARKLMPEGTFSMLGLSDKGTLHLALLGPPQVYHSGQLLVFPSHKALALLLYLAVEKGKHSRKTLSELFWPDSDAAHARSALRTTVLELRDVLRKDAIPAERTGLNRIPHLHIDRDTLSLDWTSGVSLDLHTLQTAWVHAREIARVTATLPKETRHAYLTQLQEATRLSRGEFLDGFSLHNAQGFDDWSRFQREYWHLRMQLIFDQLSSQYEDAGEFEQAIAVIIRWLALTLLNEEASQRLMRLHFATGNRVAALQAYETFRMLLAAEIHAEPTPETAALAARIRATAPARQMPQRAFPASSPWLPLLAAPFVGRTQEYHLLLERYALARQGQTQIVLLEGEAGIGKTRLATEFLDWAATQGTDVLRGQAFESNRRLAYQPFIEALRPRIERENAPEDLLHDVWLAELAYLLPELRERYPDLISRVMDVAVARNHLFEAVTRLLASLAARTPLILFLDDLHWADSASLDLLHYLARHFTAHATPLMVLLSLRTEARQATSGLAVWRANLERIVPLTRLRLDLLSVQDTVNLLQILAQRHQGKDPDRLRAASPVTHEPATFLERVGQRLFDETGGQPFYLIETLKLLLARGLFAPSPSENRLRTEDVAATLFEELGKARLFPPSVRELICIQLDRLSLTAFAFLVAGAVLEQDATFERLCIIADLSEQAGLVALDEVRRSLLVQEPAGFAVYTFTHPMIRDVVSVEAGETRSRIFHRRALHLLQETAVPVARLAYHALAAGMLDPAFRWSVAAGDEARAVFAFPVAIEHYEQAWRLLANDHARQPTISAADVYHLYVALGQTCELARAWEQDRPLYAAMLAYLLQREGSDNQKIVPVKTHWYQAMLDLSTVDLKGSIPSGEQALALARNSGQPDLLVQSLHALTCIQMYRGGWEEYEQLAAESHAYYVSQGDRVMEADVLCMLARAQRHRGQLHLGITQARHALAISQDIRNRWGQVNALYELTAGLRDSGAYTEVLEMALQAVECARTLTTHSARAKTLLLRALIQLGSVYRAMQAGDAACEIDLEALALTETIASLSDTTMVVSTLCADYVLVGEWTEARRYARQAATGAGEQGWWYAEMPHRSIVEALLHGEDAALVQRYLARLHAHKGDSQYNHVQYLQASADLAAWEGHLHEARSSLEAARILAEEIGLVEERWQIQLALGDLDQLQGKQALADQAYAQVVSMVQEIGEKIEDEALRTCFLTAPQVRRVLAQAAR
jgi:DNA-binding SARP family transcriptional activator/tetratricopeptide (TPR) repeat protein